MIPNDPVVHREIPVIQKIIADETWLEGERRGCHVQSDDRVVRENVCRVILRVGGELRESVTRELPIREGSNVSMTTSPLSAIHEFDWEI